MKKLFSILCAFLISSVVFFAGCSDKWTEVQSITYHTDSGSKTYTSTIYRNATDKESVTEEEFNNAPPEYTESVIGYGWDPSLVIPINRTETLKKVKNTVGKTIYVAAYSYDGQMRRFDKVEVESYELRYVKIRFIENDNLEINYYDEAENRTVKVKPASYEITYFED